MVFFRRLPIINYVLNFSFDFSAFPPMFFLFTASCLLDIVSPTFLPGVVRTLPGLSSQLSKSSAAYRGLMPLLPASWPGVGKVLLLYVIPSDYPLPPPGILPVFLTCKFDGSWSIPLSLSYAQPQDHGFLLYDDPRLLPPLRDASKCLDPLRHCFLFFSAVVGLLLL